MIVYSLTDPDEGGVRYIGISHHSAEKRYATHLKDAKTKYRRKLYLSNKEKWILSLWGNNKRPIIKTEFDNLSQDEAIKIESELISKYKRIYEGGTLFNVMEGGYYDSMKTTPWNRGIKQCYSQDFLDNNRKMQPNRKPVYRFDKNGNFIDHWDSIRDMCFTLGFDRRSVMRCLKMESNFKSHKGFMFSYNNTPPIYLNESTLRTYSNSPHAKAIIAIKDDQQLYFSSIKEAGEKLNIHPANISGVLTGAYKTSKGYIFKYQ